MFDDFYVADGLWDLNGTPSKYYCDKQLTLVSGLIIRNNFLEHYPLHALEHEKQHRKNRSIVDRIEWFREIVSKNYGPMREIHGHMHSVVLSENTDYVNVCIDKNRYKILKLDDVLKDKYDKTIT